MEFRRVLFRSVGGAARAKSSRRGACLPPRPAHLCPKRWLLQQLQECLRELIGLRERGDRGLAEHLARYQLALLGRKVDVHDGGLRRLDVLQRGGELLAAELEARPPAAEPAARSGTRRNGETGRAKGGE